MKTDKEIQEFLDKHEFVCSIGIGAFMVGLFLTLTILFTI